MQEQGSFPDAIGIFTFHLQQKTKGSQPVGWPEHLSLLVSVLQHKQPFMRALHLTSRKSLQTLETFYVSVKIQTLNIVYRMSGTAWQAFPNSQSEVRFNKGRKQHYQHRFTLLYCFSFTGKTIHYSEIFEMAWPALVQFHFTKQSKLPNEPGGNCLDLATSLVSLWS